MRRDERSFGRSLRSGCRDGRFAGPRMRWLRCTEVSESYRGST
nr:MAG TPA: hypothetical protein [Caudoviricetes sp.]